MFEIYRLRSFFQNFTHLSWGLASPPPSAKPMEPPPHRAGGAGSVDSSHLGVHTFDRAQVSLSHPVPRGSQAYFQNPPRRSSNSNTELLGLGLLIGGGLACLTGVGSSAGAVAIVAGLGILSTGCGARTGLRDEENFPPVIENQDAGQGLQTQQACLNPSTEHPQNVCLFTEGQGTLSHPLEGEVVNRMRGEMSERGLNLSTFQYVALPGRSQIYAMAQTSSGEARLFLFDLQGRPLSMGGASELNLGLQGATALRVNCEEKNLFIDGGNPATRYLYRISYGFSISGPLGLNRETREIADCSTLNSSG